MIDVIASLFAIFLNRSDPQLVASGSPPAFADFASAQHDVHGQKNSISAIIEDMILPGEGVPNGLSPTLGWPLRPRINWGNNPHHFRAILAWGQLYREKDAAEPSNTRIEIRNIRLYVLSKRAQEWSVVQASRAVTGAAYYEDFRGDIHTTAALRAEPDGGVSVFPQTGFNFHFWPTSGRSPIDPDDIAGVLTTFEARLILDNPMLPNDISQARYVMSAGADYWRDLAAKWDHFRTNSDAGIGRFKRVTRSWRAFNMTTASADELRANPPPIN